MTLHWWMHWFWITIIHSVVTLPLLLPGTLSAPSQDRLHGIQSSISTPPVPIGVTSWVPKAEISGGKEEAVVTEAAASDGGHLSPPLMQNDQGGLVNPVTAVEESSSKADIEATSFLEKEDERSWGLEDPAPRPPFFLQSGLDLENDEEEDEGIHLPAGMPWPPPSVPRVEISSPSVRPTIIPSQESPSSTVEPWPANKTLDQSSADAVHSREGKAIGVSHVDQQPKQEQKQIEVVDGSEDTPSTTTATSTTTTTLSPTTVNVESSPVKSSSNLNSTADVVGREDKDVRDENVTTDSSVPVKDASSSNSSEKVVEGDKAEDEHLTPVINKEAKVDDKKDTVSGRNETGSINVDSSVVDKDSSNVGKPTKEEDIAPPVEVPTAVAVREGSASIHSDSNKDQDEGVQPSEKDEKDSILAAADVPSSVHQGRMTAPRSLDTASIVGISLGSVLLVGAVAGGVGFILYRRSLYANKPQTLNDKCSNPDSSGYIDDTLRVSSACSANLGQRPQRSRMEMSRNGGPGKRGGGRGGGAEGGKERRQNEPKENSEEMYSLDNDSFLNSLEAMTIQNYWTDSVKHTKL